MSAFHGLQYAGTPGLLTAMLRMQAMRLCTLAQCSSDDLLTMLMNEMMIGDGDDDTL